ncbi:MAG: adenine deaminase, partial [Chitinophagaceae bacterium]
MNLIKGNIVDIFEKEIYYGEIEIAYGKIKRISRLDFAQDFPAPFVLPGFVDAHVHIESSLLIPSEFSRLAVVHGTVATISDPHEIANVCGIEGVEYMINNGNTVPFKFHFGAPSCVPATSFETAGDVLTSEDVDRLLKREEIFYLSEMMNFPGVLHDDPEVLAKIASAKKYNKPVDGHAPGLRGEAVKKYISAGISTDHECFTEEEAAEKLSLGMKILIREGSAAKNFEALAGLIEDNFENIMFCSDDKHPDSLLEGHINQLCARAVAKGINLFKVLQAACVNPVQHYKMKVGLLREGDAADLVVVKNLTDFEVLQTYIEGELVAENGSSNIAHHSHDAINRFDISPIDASSLQYDANGNPQIRVIGALDGQLITEKILYTSNVENGRVVANTL